MATLLNFGFTKPTSATPLKGNESEPDLNNNESHKSSIMRRTFNNRWLNEYSWLAFDDTTKSMRCKFCTKSKRSNPFGLNGSKNFQRSALERHQSSDDHRIATSNKKKSEVFSKTVNEKFEKTKPAVSAMFRTVAFMVEEDIADRKFEKLIDLQVRIQYISK